MAIQIGDTSFDPFNYAQVLQGVERIKTARTNRMIGENKLKRQGQMKPSDSNAIARAIGDAFGGIYDPQKGTFTGLDKDLAARVLAIMARAEEIWAEAKASGKPIGHRTAANRAMKEGKAARGGSGAGSDPLGIRN